MTPELHPQSRAGHFAFITSVSWKEPFLLSMMKSWLPRLACWGTAAFFGHGGGLVQMIRIRVLSIDGSAPAQPSQAEFAEAGGTIGRAESNDLVLDDPDRHVSRVQARVECGTAGCRLTNLGTNPVDVDGRGLSTGEAAALRAGVRIVIGRYVLEALDLREAGVVSMRFGLSDGQPKTLDEIGKVYGVTRERIRQIESKTMSKLRHPSRSQALRDYLD